MRSKSVILLLLFAIVFLMADANVRFLKKKRKAQTSLRNDSIVQDSTEKSAVDTMVMDSLQLAIYHHNKQIDDSIRLDSLNKLKVNGLEAPVEYASNDSMIYDAKTRTAYLYGDASVKYEQMDLKSEKSQQQYSACNWCC